MLREERSGTTDVRTVGGDRPSALGGQPLSLLPFIDGTDGLRGVRVRWVVGRDDDLCQQGDDCTSISSATSAVALAQHSRPSPYGADADRRAGRSVAVGTNSTPSRGVR
jgi:hypothetical protein